MLNVILIYLVMRFPIYCNFKFEIENIVYTRCCGWRFFPKATHTR